MADRTVLTTLHMADRTVLTNRDLLQYWKGKHARWSHLSLLARLYVGVDSISFSIIPWIIFALVWQSIRLIKTDVA